jgi:hypothetical protein
MLWHIVFGIEVDVEALLSPTHLLLATGLALMISGPARAAWRRARGGLVADGWTAQLPMVVSLTFVLALLGFFSQYVHPLSSAWAAASWQPVGQVVHTVRGEELEIPFLFQAPMLSGTMLQTALLVGVLLLGLRHARLPIGTMSLLIGLTTVMMVFMRQRFVGDVREPLLIAGVFAGIVADGLLAWLRPSFARPQALRLFAAVVPVLTYASYFGALLASSGVWWTVHLWAGTLLLAGVIGYLMAVLGTQLALAPAAVGAAGSDVAVGDAVVGRPS